MKDGAKEAKDIIDRSVMWVIYGIRQHKRCVVAGVCLRAAGRLYLRMPDDEDEE